MAPSAHLVHNDDDIDDPWSHSDVHFTRDVVSSGKKLRRHTLNWRGITALEPWSPPPITVQQLPHRRRFRPAALLCCTHYAAIPSEHFINPRHHHPIRSIPIRPPQCVCSPLHAKSICPPHRSSRSWPQLTHHGRQDTARPQWMQT